ncbi:Y-family DNA polymerase [Massiliimalia massiliensis]|uniref:Y-family DNA polymerase n=1 Tax=Massiliimalia massiliensis TaxID=1852384 RepID=UPI0038991D12
MNRVILHSDMNNFYASVESLYHPEYRGKPMAAAGDPEQRHGIVLAKNYEAKAFGVQTGDPLWFAKQKYPDIIFAPAPLGQVSPVLSNGKGDLFRLYRPGRTLTGTVRIFLYSAGDHADRPGIVQP